MMTTTTTELESVVHKVLNEVLGHVSEALASTTDDHAPDTTNGSASTGRAVRAAPAKPSTDVPPEEDEDETQAPDDSADEDATETIPPAVLAAVEELCRDLSPEQASALAAMFEAMSGEQDDGDIEAQPAEFGVVEALPDGRGAKAPNGWFCIYQYPNFKGRMLKFNAGTNHLARWGFKNKGSSYINNTRRTITLTNTDPVFDDYFKVRPGEQNKRLNPDWDNKIDMVKVG
jgi:hypothetical protein